VSVRLNVADDCDKSEQGGLDELVIVVDDFCELNSFASFLIKIAVNIAKTTIYRF
jgi:hypothetical protein